MKCRENTPNFKIGDTLIHPNSPGASYSVSNVRDNIRGLSYQILDGDTGEDWWYSTEFIDRHLKKDSRLTRALFHARGVTND